MKSYCAKENKQMECVEPSGYQTAKNGRLMFFLYISILWNKKKQNLLRTQACLRLRIRETN